MLKTSSSSPTVSSSSSTPSRSYESKKMSRQQTTGLQKTQANNCAPPSKASKTSHKLSQSFSASSSPSPKVTLSSSTSKLSLSKSDKLKMSSMSDSNMSSFSPPSILPSKPPTHAQQLKDTKSPPSKQSHKSPVNKHLRNTSVPVKGKNSPKTMISSTNKHTSNTATSASILTRPAHPHLKYNPLPASKKVQFKHNSCAPQTNVCSTKEKSVYLHSSQNTPSFERSGTHKPLRISFPCVDPSQIPSLISPLSTQSPTKHRHSAHIPSQQHPLGNFSHFSNQTNKPLSPQIRFHSAKNSPKASKNSPSTTPSLQQKFSWDESLQQLSKGLKNICGSPDAFSLKSFKRASSLSTDSRRQQPSPHLSPHLSPSLHRTMFHHSTSVGNTPQSSYRKSSPLCSTSPKEAHVPQLPSKSPTIFVACREEEFFGFIPVPNVVSVADTDELTIEEIDVFDLINTSNDKNMANKHNDIAHGHASTNKNENQMKLGIPLFRTNMQSKRNTMEKQRSMLLEDDASMLSFQSFGNSKKITVRHEETFQSLETELQRVLGGQINKKLATSSKELSQKVKVVEKNDLTGRKKCNPYTDMWKDEEDEDDDDGLEWISNDYSTLQRIPLPKSNVCLGNVYTQIMKDKTIEVGVLKDLPGNKHNAESKFKQLLESTHEKEVIKHIESFSRKTSDLICTVSKNLKWLLLKEKKAKIQGWQGSNHSCNTHHFSKATNHFNNDKHFVSFSESLACVYLPIFVEHSNLHETFLSIFLKLPHELQCDTLSVKRIDDSVLVSGGKGTLHTSPLKSPFFNHHTNSHSINSMNNFMEETLKDDKEVPQRSPVTYDFCNQNQQPPLNKPSTSNQINNKCVQRLSPEVTHDRHFRFSSSPISATSTDKPSNHSAHQPSTSPSSPFTDSSFNSTPNSPPNLSFKPARTPSDISPSNSSPELFASFTLPCNSIPRSTTAHLTHHHVLTITVPINHTLQRRFSF